MKRGTHGSSAVEGPLLPRVVDDFPTLFALSTITSPTSAACGVASTRYGRFSLDVASRGCAITREAGRLADDRVASEALASRCQRARPIHGALLVGRAEDGDRPAKRPALEAGDRMEGGREEAFHVCGAEAVQLSVTLGEHERIVGPARGIVGNRVGMPREHETVFALAERCDQIGLSGLTGERLDAHGKAEPGRPFGKELDDPTVRLIETKVLRADGWRGDQLANHLECGWKHPDKIAPNPTRQNPDCSQPRRD